MIRCPRCGTSALATRVLGGPLPFRLSRRGLTSPFMWSVPDSSLSNKWLVLGDPGYGNPGLGLLSSMFAALELYPSPHPSDGCNCASVKQAALLSTLWDFFFRHSSLPMWGGSVGISLSVLGWVHWLVSCWSLDIGCCFDLLPWERWGRETGQWLGIRGGLNAGP